MMNERDRLPERTAAAFEEARSLHPVEHTICFNSPIADLVANTGLVEAAFEPIPITDIGPTRPFAETIAARRSSRRLAAPTVYELGLVVARCGLTKDWSLDVSGARIDQNPAPSAGGRHPLSLVVLAQEVTGLAPGGWVLDPDSACLRRGGYTPHQVADAFDALAIALRQDRPPPAAVVAVAHPDRTLTRYPDGISLLWREAGALLMLVHLAATDLGLGSCITGTCGVLHSVISGLENPIDLGAVALGTIPDDDAERDQAGHGPR